LIFTNKNSKSLVPFFVIGFKGSLMLD